jgi:hypothetical protein
VLVGFLGVKVVTTLAAQLILREPSHSLFSNALSYLLVP